MPAATPPAITGNVKSCAVISDRREAREYDEKIRDKQKEIYRDRREIYGDNDGRSGRDYGWWRRDRDRDHYYD